MDRRTFSRLAAGACAAPLGTLVGCGGGAETAAEPAAAAAKAGAQPTALGSIGVAAPTVCKWRATPNPTGLRLGFWEVFGKQEVTLARLGRRPSARVGFDDWNRIEKAAGVYEFPDDSQRYDDTHRHGESVLASVNISFRVPALYPNDITNATTRTAAKNFLRAYVRWLLGRFGAAALTIDYEIISNAELYRPGSRPRAEAWATWYVEAAAVAREEAASMGMSALLTLQPIVNGNPLEPESLVVTGAAGNPWLVRVVEASDALALDTYFRDETRPTDPTRTIEIIDFWRKEFSAGKPVVVAEHGFSTILTEDPAAPLDPRKYFGTREDQQAYYAALFPMLLEANRPDGRFRNQLRGFHLWSITDNPVAEKPQAKYYGLYDPSGQAAKPAAATVQQFIRQLEGDQLQDGDAFHRPYSRSGSSVNLATQLRDAANPVDLVFREGDDFEFLRYKDTGPAGDVAQVRLEGQLDGAATLLLCVNGSWQARDVGSELFSVDISANYRLGAANVIDVHVTGAAFPVHRQVRSLRVAYT